jgi:hypothetical protein
VEKLTYWEINSRILRERYPRLLEEILQDTNNIEDIKIEKASTGVPTMLAKGLYVHSPRDPEREGRRLAEAFLAENNRQNTVVILGFGLGYTAQAFTEIVPKKPVVIVEKNPALLRKAFELRNLESLLSGADIAFVLSGEGVYQALSYFHRDERKRHAPYILHNRTLTGIDEQWYSAVENRIKAWVMQDDVNNATLNKFGKRWIRNIMQNMKAIRDLPGISALSGLAQQPGMPDLPVFLAAAGPGLDSIAVLLPEIRKRCIIIAVDTSLRFFSENNVDPDFVLVVDPQFHNSRHLDRCAYANTRLIAESAVYPPVLRLPFRSINLCGSLFPMGKFIEERVDTKGPLGTGGSVATSAWDFSRMLGARQIWIAGLDLAFPGLKTHYHGAYFEQKALAECKRLHPAETWLLHNLRSGIPFKAPSFTDGTSHLGGQVLTDRRLSLYASWFERNFHLSPNIKNYSLSPGGFAISGLEPANQEAFLALPRLREEIDRRLEAVFLRIDADFFGAEETQRRIERFGKAVNQLHSGLEKIKSACKRGEKIASNALRQNSSPKEQEKTLLALDVINNIITGSEVKEIAGFLFPAEALTEINPCGSGKDSLAAFRGYLASSVRLYKSLAEAAELKPYLK